MASSSLPSASPVAVNPIPSPQDIALLDNESSLSQTMSSCLEEVFVNPPSTSIVIWEPEERKPK